MKIGDLVTRIKHNHDIVFKITKIENGVAKLVGETIRLKADAFLSDLSIYNQEKEDEKEVLEFIRNSKLINGCVLHLDGDEYYLKKCMEIYKKYDIPALGYFMEESEMPKRITNLLIEHKPDVLVITGHDHYKKENGKESFENSKYFINAVKKARVYQPSKDALVIFAGACQSYYEALIESGANFASSPSRKNINVLDPVYIAISVARSHVNWFIDVEETLKKTVSKGIGLGGIDTRGVARKLYQQDKS
jgi:spore coat assembly protein